MRKGKRGETKKNKLETATPGEHEKSGVQKTHKPNDFATTNSKARLQVATASIHETLITNHRNK